MTPDQNRLLALRHAAGGAPRTDMDRIVDGCTGCQMIEILAAILPVEWSAAILTGLAIATTAMS